MDDHCVSGYTIHVHVPHAHAALYTYSVSHDKLLWKLYGMLAVPTSCNSQIDVDLNRHRL